LVGLAVEIASVFILRKSLLEGALTIASAAFIWVGVWGELLFAKRAKEAGDGIVAQANARAAEAELALVKFRQPRQSYVKGNEALITERLKPFAGTKFDSGLAANSGEVADFWWDLEPVITAAGWLHLPWNPLSVGMLVYQGLRPVSGSVGASNVEIHIRPEERATLGPAGAALISVLNEIGIEAMDIGFNSHSANPEAIHIHIGDKRWLFLLFVIDFRRRLITRSTARSRPARRVGTGSTT